MMCGWTGSHHIDQSGLGRLLVSSYNRRQFQTRVVSETDSILYSVPYMPSQGPPSENPEQP